MAKKSLVRRNKKRIALSKNHLSKRSQLHKIDKNVSLNVKQRLEAYLKLADLPRDGSEVRVRNRCNLTGRPRGNLRKFGVSRMALRELALWGQIPGLIKSSW